MNALGASILAVVLCVVIFSSRRWAVIAIFAGILYLTQGQQLQVFGFNMYAIRFVEVAAFFRVIHRREFSFSNLNPIDKAVIWLFAYSTIVFVIRSNELIVSKIGSAVDAYLCYFSFRGLIVDVKEFKWFLRAFLLLLVPYTALVLVESFTTQNPFAIMGGLEYGDWIRGGRLRCQGSFRQASLLGSFGAYFFPLYVALWFDSTYRKSAVVGAAMGLLIVWASNSGGPASAAASAIAGWTLWVVRTKMKFVRRALVAGIVLIALVMNAPIWYLIARVSSISGGAGWHRAHLLDMAFQNLDKWWLAGMPIHDTQNWFPYVLSITGGADITNQFLAYGIDSGIIAMFLFMGLVVLAYKRIGKALAVVRAHTPNRAQTEPLLWGIGVMLTVHCVTWLGITYFDQSYVILFFHLAVIANITEACIKTPSPVVKSVNREVYPDLSGSVGPA